MVEINDKLISEAMGYLTEGHQKALDELLEGMSEEHKYYFMGYVAGYTEAVHHLAVAEKGE